MRDAYKVTVNRHGVLVEPRAWMVDAHFSVSFFPTKKANARLAKHICEKMNRAFKTGRIVERDQ